MDSEATMTLWEQPGLLLTEPLRRGYERRWNHGAGARKYNHLSDAVRAMFEVDADGEGSPREAIFATLAVAHAVAENVGGQPNSALLRRCICAAVSHLGTDEGDARVGAADGPRTAAVRGPLGRGVNRGGGGGGSDDDASEGRSSEADDGASDDEGALAVGASKIQGAGQGAFFPRDVDVGEEFPMTFRTHEDGRQLVFTGEDDPSLPAYIKEDDEAYLMEMTLTEAERARAGVGTHKVCLANHPEDRVMLANEQRKHLANCEYVHRVRDDGRIEGALRVVKQARAGKEATVFYGDKFRRVEYTLASRKRRRARGGGGGSRVARGSPAQQQKGRAARAARRVGGGRPPPRSRKRPSRSSSRATRPRAPPTRRARWTTTPTTRPTARSGAAAAAATAPTTRTRSARASTATATTRRKRAGPTRRTRCPRADGRIRRRNSANRRCATSGSWTR